MKRTALAAVIVAVAMTLYYLAGAPEGASLPASAWGAAVPAGSLIAGTQAAGTQDTAAQNGAPPVAGAAAPADEPHKSWLGGPCASDSDCAVRGGRCLQGADFPGGHCTAPCKEKCADRAGEPVTFCASEEADFGDGAASCVTRCDYDKFPGASAGCRDGYECLLAARAGPDDVTESVCLPARSGVMRGSVPLPWRRYPGGRQALVSLSTAPFPHESRAHGHIVDGVYYSRARHYNDSSAFLIVPRRFVDKGNVDLVVHFHGFNGDIRRLVETKKLRQQFFAAKRNAVLVLVQGPKSVPDSHPGKVGEPGGFRNLVTEVVSLLHADGVIAKRRVGAVALTSHSGGYRAVAAALDERLLGRRICEVYLFDSFYGEYGAFFDYATKTKGRLVSLVTSELVGANATFKSRLQEARVPYATDLAEDERLTFLRTRVSHADAPRCGNFQRFLESANIEEPSLPR